MGQVGGLGTGNHDGGQRTSQEGLGSVAHSGKTRTVMPEASGCKRKETEKRTMTGRGQHKGAACQRSSCDTISSRRRGRQRHCPSGACQAGERPSVGMATTPLFHHRCAKKATRRWPPVFHYSHHAHKQSIKGTINVLASLVTSQRASIEVVFPPTKKQAPTVAWRNGTSSKR